MDRNPLSAPQRATPIQPFFEQLQQEMERMFDRFRGHPTLTPALSDYGLNVTLTPAIDLAETDEGVEITAEIAGVAPDDLKVTLNGDMLIIRGEKSDERTEDEKDYHLRERSFGSFRRQIPLGFTPADDAIVAEFADGLLKLTLTRPTESKTAHRKIAITAG